MAEMLSTMNNVFVLLLYPTAASQSLAYPKPGGLLFLTWLLALGVFDIFRFLSSRELIPKLLEQF